MPGTRTPVPLRGRLALLLCGTLAALWMAEVPARATEPTATEPARPARGQHEPAGGWQRALLDRYCVACHNERLRTAGLTLDAHDVNRIADAPGVWETVVRKLRAGAMPPLPRPRPDAATLRSLHRLAGDRARSGGGRRSEPGAHRGVPPAQPDRVPPRRTRPPRPGDRRRGVAAGRRGQLRVRQHRRGARRLADAARALPRRGAQDQPSCGGTSRAVGHGRGLPPRQRSAAGRLGGGDAVRHARRRRVSPRISRGRRLRDSHPPGPQRRRQSGRLRGAAHAGGEPGRRAGPDVHRRRPAALPTRRAMATSTAPGGTGSGPSTTTGSSACRSRPGRTSCA